MTIKTESIITIDVDDTLVMWAGGESIHVGDTQRKAKYGSVIVANPHDGEICVLKINKPNIKLLKDRKARGSFIVVWSQGGYAWAEAVVKVLNLENHVDLIMTKPHAYIDDKPCEKWMGEHIYLSPDSPHGQ